MEYHKSCKFCRKAFVANRKDKEFHDNACKSKHWKLLQGFELVAELVPEAEAKEKFVTKADKYCIVYLQWFKIDSERFADVYVSNECSEALIKRFKKIPTTRHYI